MSFRLLHLTPRKHVALKPKIAPQVKSYKLVALCFIIHSFIQKIPTTNCQLPEMEFVTTTRGGRALIYEGYKYVLNRRGRDERIFWRCAKSRCCSGALTTINDEIVSSRASEHNHPPNEAEMIACKAVESMKQAVKEKINPVPALYQQQLREILARENLEEVAAQLPTLYSMKSLLYRLRRK